MENGIIKLLKSGRRIICRIEYWNGKYYVKTGKPSDDCCISWTYDNLEEAELTAQELFDTMKRLADVSAGLGVDMQRVILAYGQVKAASVLRGSELRQFTEAGIPLVQALADKFTQLRGELVSTGEVFDLISKRAVSFEMVKEIFEDMTNAGGMFYEMQEKQSETLAGQCPLG